MLKIEINLDFEYLEKINRTNSEIYWKFVDSYAKYFQERCILAGKDYLKKKGITETKTFEEHQKMQRALNHRKELVRLRHNLLRLNFMPMEFKKEIV